MKKLFLVVVSLLAMVCFSSCNQEVSETSLIGRWQMVSIQMGGQIAHESEIGYQVWEFTKDHEMNVYFEEGKESSGKWSLEGDLLRLDLVQTPMKVTLSSTKLVLSITDEKDGTIIYTFKKQN